MPELHHLKLFGVPRLLNRTRHPVGLRTRKHLGLLVYLALEGRDRPVSRDVLVELFWSDSPESRSRHSLSQALTTIRFHLGRDAFATSTAGVSLVRGLTTDLDTADGSNLEQDDLSRPLDGLETCGGTTFAHWVDRSRQGCTRQMRTRLLADLAAARTMGNLYDVHQAASLLHALDPLSDAAVLALAEQHLLDGDSASAIRLLRAHIDLSEDKLGRDPPRDLTLLLNRLERGLLSRPSLSGMPDIKDRPSLIRPEVFVGREDELSRLEATWTSACRGALTTCLISGCAGVGKSALVRRFATSVTARAWPAYVVVCQEIGSNIPFAAVSDLVYQLMRDPALGGTDPIWLAEASRVTPGLRAVYSGIPEPPSTPPEAVRLRVAEGLYRMLDTVTDGGPLLLVLDQFQNIDPASRDVLHVLKLRLEETPTLMLATTRSNEAEFILTGPETVGGLDWITCVELCALDTAQTLHLIADLLKQCDGMDGDVVQRVAELSQGNPYLVEMLVSDWRNNGPDSLVSREMGDVADATAWRPPQTMRLAFDRQYKGLTAAAQHLIHLLAVAGRNVPVTELETILGVSSPALDLAALEVIDRAIIRTAGGALGFKNELHRAFVYWAMSAEARSYHHARLARCVPTAPDDDDFQRALEASHHYLKAGMDKEAIDTVCVGAEVAITRGAPKEAEKALKAVISSENTSTVARLDLLLARALGAQGKYREVLDHLASWTPNGPSALDVAHAASVRAEALHRGRLADDSTIRATVGEAVKLAQAAGDELLVTQTLQLSAEVASDNGDWQALGSIRAKAAAVEHTRTQPETVAVSRVTQGYCLLVAGDVAMARLQFDDCLDSLRRLSLNKELRQALNGLGMAHYCLGSAKDAISAFERAMSVAKRIGDTAALATMSSNLGAVREDLGDFQQAENCYQRALELEAKASNPRRAAEVHMNLASLRLITRDTQDALRCLSIAKVNAAQSQLWWLQADVLLAEADYHIAGGTPETAWPLVEEAQAVTRGRVYLFSNRGKYERLRIHHLWFTQGFAAVQRLCQTENLRDRCLLKSGFLEVQALVDWIRQCECVGEKSAGTALDELAGLELHGTIARLSMLGVGNVPRTGT